MNTSKGGLPVQMPRKFDQLHELWSLRPIRDDIDLENATNVMDRLAVINRPTKDQSDYLETLSLLIEEYEGTNDIVGNAAKNPIELLKYLMEQNEVTQAQLAELLGIGARLR